MFKASIEMGLCADVGDFLEVTIVQMCVETEEPFVDIFNFGEEVTWEFGVLIHGKQIRIRNLFIYPIE